MSKPAVSNHALLRFLERTGLPVEALREKIAESLERAHTAAGSIGSTNYLILADGLVYVVRRDVVTTVMVQGDPGDLARHLRFTPEQIAAWEREQLA